MDNKFYVVAELRSPRLIKHARIGSFRIYYPSMLPVGERLSQLNTPLKLNDLLVEERISTGLAALVEYFAGLFVRQRINSVQKQILKEPIRARFIKRGDERNCFWTEWTFRDYK